LIRAIEAALDDQQLKKPLSRKKKNHLPQRWWNEECQQAVNKGKAALKVFTTESTPGNYVRYITTVAETKVTLEKAKNRSWQDFTGSIGPNTPMAVVWRMAKAFANSRSGQPQDKGGWLEPFLARFSPDWVLPEPPDFSVNGQEILPIFSKPFT